MLFSSISFLFYFLPAIILLYYIVPFKAKNAVLLAFSLFFYAWGGVKYAGLMIIAIILGYIFGLLIEKFREKKIAKLFVGLAVFIYIFHFAVQNVHIVIFFQFLPPVFLICMLSL